MLHALFNMSSEEKGINILRSGLEKDTLFELVSLIIQWICFTVLCPAIDVLGVFTNIINIVVFAKQGFTDTVNISLLGLAVSDIGCVSTLIVSNICYSPVIRGLDLSFDSIDVNYLTSGIPHTVFTRITCWITALITLERCLCIAAPLQVQAILTSKRVKIIITSVFLISMSTATPAYIVNKLDMKFFPERNKTLLGLVYLENRDAIEEISFLVNNITLPFISFVIIVLCTGILVYKLQEATKWRTKSKSSFGDNASSQNQKVIKMVVMISTLFIICFTPMSLMFIGFLLEPEMFIGGKYTHILITFGSLGLILESVNSSMNIFIYFKMSSKYRTVFKRIFSLTNVHSRKRYRVSFGR